MNRSKLRPRRLLVRWNRTNMTVAVGSLVFGLLIGQLATSTMTLTLGDASQVFATIALPFIFYYLVERGRSSHQAIAAYFTDELRVVATQIDQAFASIFSFLDRDGLIWSDHQDVVLEMSRHANIYIEQLRAALSNTVALWRHAEEYDLPVLQTALAECVLYVTGKQTQVTTQLSALGLHNESQEIEDLQLQLMKMQAEVRTMYYRCLAAAQGIERSDKPE